MFASCCSYRFSFSNRTFRDSSTFSCSRRFFLWTCLVGLERLWESWLWRRNGPNSSTCYPFSLHFDRSSLDNQYNSHNCSFLYHLLLSSGCIWNSRSKWKHIQSLKTFCTLCTTSFSRISWDFLWPSHDDRILQRYWNCDLGNSHKTEVLINFACFYLVVSFVECLCSFVLYLKKKSLYSCYFYFFLLIMIFKIALGFSLLAAFGPLRKMNKEDLLEHLDCKRKSLEVSLQRPLHIWTPYSFNRASL